MEGMAGDTSTSQQSATITKEELSLLAKRLESYQSAIDDPKSILRVVLATKKKEFFNSWAEDLELGIKVGIVKNLQVNEINAYIRRQLEKAGLVNAIPYAKEVIPAKYKRHDLNPGSEDKMEENLHEDSSLNIVTCPACGASFSPSEAEQQACKARCTKCDAPVVLTSFEHENERYIDLLELYKQGINLVINKMRTGHFTKLILARRLGESTEDAIRRGEEFEQAMLMQYAAVQLLHEIFDDRQGVPVNTQHFLLGMAMKINIDEAATYYFNDVKGKLDMTRKQTRKIVGGEIRGAFTKDGLIDFRRVKEIKGKLHLALEPKTAWQARLLGFIGHQCPECACWRVHYKAHPELTSKFMDYCYGCTNWFDPPFETLYCDPNAVMLLPAKMPVVIKEDKIIDADGKAVAVLTAPPAAPQTD